MNNALRSQFAVRLGVGLALAAGLLSAQAQTSSRSVHAVPQRQAPALAAGSVGFGAPNPVGLPSPLPNPAGLNSQFPAGLPSPPVTTAAGVPVSDSSTAASSTTPAGGGVRVVTPDVAPQTSAMGYGAPAGPLSPALGSGPYTALQIAQSFLAADANRDGELTRAEAQRLTIAPYTFEEMDRNHDGVITRFEYEDAMHSR